MRFLSDKMFVKVKAACLRITRSKVTLAFFLFGFIHCLVLGLIQLSLYSVDSQSSHDVSNILREAQVPQRAFGWLTRPGGAYRLRVCNEIKDTPHQCDTIFESGNATISSVVPKPLQPTSKILERETNLLLAPNDTPVVLNDICTRILVYPDQILKNMRREDLTLVAMQFWLFSMSFIALMYDSIPHILSLLFARMLVTSWSIYATWRTTDVEKTFRVLVGSIESPCHIDLFSTYNKNRLALEITNLISNLLGLLIFSFLSFDLVKTFNGQTFRRAGPPKGIIRIYGVFMAFLVGIQLSVFTLVAAMALWVNQLKHSAIASISSHTPIYEALFICTLVFLLPWLTVGWFSVHRELKAFMLGFLVLSFIFIASWSIMFYSSVYRWTFMQWPFLACITVESFIVLIGSMALGILCWFNFGKGLKHYLYVEDVLQSMDIKHQVFPHRANDVEKGEEEMWEMVDMTTPIVERRPVAIDLPKRTKPSALSLVHQATRSLSPFVR